MYLSHLKGIPLDKAIRFGCFDLIIFNGSVPKSCLKNVKMALFMIIL